MFALTAFFIYELYKKKKLDLFMFSGIYILSFFLFYRIFYPHYLIWIIPYLSIIVIKYIEKKHFRKLFILFSVIFIEVIAIVLWYLDFFDLFQFPFGILLTLSFINLFCLIFYQYVFFKFRRESNPFVVLKIGENSWCSSREQLYCSSHICIIYEICPYIRYPYWR